MFSLKYPDHQSYKDIFLKLLPGGSFNLSIQVYDPSQITVINSVRAEQRSIVFLHINTELFQLHLMKRLCSSFISANCVKKQETFEILPREIGVK